MKKILVTGCAGFIGSHLVETLLARGDKVVGIDNFDNYYDPFLKFQNIAKLKHENFTPVTLDIRNEDLLKEVFKQHKFDVVIHLAALAGVRASIALPKLYYDVNVLGSINLMNLSVEHKITNFVFASTSSVHGNSQNIPFVETDNCDRPLAPYPASKRAIELLGYTYNNLHNLNFTALRFFTVYGPRNRPDMMAFKLLHSIYAQPETISVPFYGDEVARDWTYVQDIVDGIVLACDKPLGYEIINIGRGAPVKLREFLTEMETLLGFKASLIEEKLPASDMNITYADITKARNLLGYSPKFDFREGIKKLNEWYSNEVYIG